MNPTIIALLITLNSLMHAHPRIEKDVANNITITKYQETTDHISLMLQRLNNEDSISSAIRMMKQIVDELENEIQYHSEQINKLAHNTHAVTYHIERRDELLWERAYIMDIVLECFQMIKEKMSEESVQ